MTNVFAPTNARDKPAGSRFFLGETVLHIGDQQMYTVCSLSHYQQDYYLLWPLGCTCTVPTHGSRGRLLVSVAEVVEAELPKNIGDEVAMFPKILGNFTRQPNPTTHVDPPNQACGLPVGPNQGVIPGGLRGPV